MARAAASNRYHPGMRTLILNLRDVPDDEADEVRALLAEHEIACYETPPNRWGVSAGGIWVADADDARRAQRLVSDYQRARGERMRAAYAVARREGRVDTLWSILRNEPLRVLVVAFTIALMLGLAWLPVYLLGR